MARPLRRGMVRECQTSRNLLVAARPSPSQYGDPGKVRWHRSRGASTASLGRATPASVEQTCGSLRGQFWTATGRVGHASEICTQTPWSPISHPPWRRDIYGRREFRTCTGVSPPRGQHHGHGPSPDGIGQPVPGGGQFGYLCRYRLGLHQPAQSLGLVGCGASYARELLARQRP
jgi:hypothetical protein